MGRSVAVLVFPGVQALDVTGPMDVFCEANRFLPAEDHYRLRVIGVEAVSYTHLTLPTKA